MGTDERTGNTLQAGYALGQLARALSTSEWHADTRTRARAQARVERWQGVLRGMLDGSTNVGSRTPLAATPAWATLEVVKGGFATGALLAGGPLRAHEQALLARLGRPADAGRAALNAYYLTEDGLRALAALLANSCYRIEVPEEGALLVLAWLLQHDQADAARALLDAILPFFDRLRFYPEPSPQPLAPRPVVRLRSVGQLAMELRTLETPLEVQRMNEALRVWIPLADRAVALFAETVEGDAPTLVTDEQRAPRRRTDGGYVIEGGWPCRRYPDGWQQRARRLLDDDSQARAAHRLCHKSDRRRENYPRLRGYLERCVAQPEMLTGRDVGMIRKILASVNAKRGLPGSPALVTLRRRQTVDASRPTTSDFGAVLAERLRGQPQDDGLASLDQVTAEVTADEARAVEAPRAIGAEIPAHLVRKLLRCLEASVDTLVAKRVITSSEVLARVLPQLTSQIAAAGIQDPALRLLHGALYTAFRQRRSLLLLNLQHQVRIEELPWVAAIAPLQRNRLDERERARQALEQLTLLALASFPHMLLPNKLLQELRALAKTAQLELPFVDEIAADIFMGTFSDKYVVAAKTAARLLEGSLYERYYGLPYARVRSLAETTTTAAARSTSKERWRDQGFARLCVELTPVPWQREKIGSVAHNGAVIEQEQILTTHNLAGLFAELGLAEKLPLGELARDTFDWICRQHQLGIQDGRARLQMIKNTAYAWRQLIFFLSLAGDGEQREFAPWATQQLDRQTPVFRERFAPAVRGLAQALAGSGFDEQGRATTPDGEARRFLGWSTERHWLMG